MSSFDSLSDLNLFIIAGMPRSGTTFLYHNLQKHPSFFLPYRKEIDFYSFNYNKGVKWYRDYFKGKKKNELGGDVSPGYFLSDKVIDRIKKHDQNAKIILLIRKPSDFAVSWHEHMSTFLYNVPDFETFIHEFSFPKGDTCITFKLINNFTPNIIKLYQQTFGNKLLLINYELLKNNPLKLFKGIEAFLKAPSFFTENNFDNLVINPRKDFNYKFSHSLLNNEKLIPLFVKIFGRNTIKKIRNKREIKTAKKNINTETNQQLEYKYKIADKYFNEQNEMIKQLFHSSDILLGQE